MRSISDISSTDAPRSRRLPWAVAVVLIALSFAPPPTAGAQSSRAAELAAEATRIARHGDVEEAIVKLREAVEIDPGSAGLRFQLASMLAAMGNFDEAGPVFSAVVERDPTNSAARRGEITALLFRSQYLEARAKLEEGLQALPQDGQLAHTLARVLATAPLDGARDGPTALALALEVWEVKKLYDTGETVAMAMAEAGRFEDAVEFQRGLIDQAEAAAEEARLEGLRQRLLAYLGGKPWRAESPAEIAMATEPPRSTPPP
ncbi:MAG: tetratricopeptide repeat protein [Thermoanaerobaculia bacterium]